MCVKLIQQNHWNRL